MEQVDIGNLCLFGVQYTGPESLDIRRPGRVGIGGNGFRFVPGLRSQVSGPRSQFCVLRLGTVDPGLETWLGHRDVFAQVDILNCIK